MVDYKSELPFMGKADLDAVALPGDVVNNIHRHGLYARFYGKIYVSRLDKTAIHQGRGRQERLGRHPRRGGKGGGRKRYQRGYERLCGGSGRYF